MAARRWQGQRSRNARERVRRLRLPCYLCGQPIDYDAPPGTPRSLTVDHEVSKKLAPELMFDPANLKPCCWSCNSRKGTGSGDHLRPLPKSREW